MNNRRNFFTGLVLFLSITNVWGQPTQTNAQRDVAYKTSTEKVFKVPCDVEIDSLSPLDFVYLEAKPAVVRIGEFVIKDNKLSVINAYPQMPRYENDYEFQMGKSVTDAWGTRLYTHEGEEYYNLPNEEENTLFTIGAEEIAKYGFFNGLFDVSIPEIQAFCDSVGIPIHVSGQKIVVFYTENVEGEGTKRTETEMDLEQLYFEMRLYKNNVHSFTDRTEYQRTADGWVIPMKKVHVYYSELPSQTRYQITEVETYLSYSVVDNNGNVLVNVGNENPEPFAIQLTPNPANDNIIVHFSTPIAGTVNAKITDVASNNRVWEQSLDIVGNEWNIDISQLEPGLYSVLCAYNGNEARADFTKEGIGLYLVPANVEMNVLPNPVQDHLSVYFPVPIDAVMNIKIMDAMGNKHLDVPKFVAGNVLQINGIGNLPPGVYYIFCTNDTWTGYTEFVKQ